VVLIETILDMFDCKTSEIFAAQVQALLNRPDATAVLKSLQVPTLMACGSQDMWAPPAQHQAMQAWVSHAKLEILPNAGHMLPMEQPQATAEVLLRWLEGYPD
jgi:pimeloyl-ACP methyl ester carboxylesterase